MTGLDAVWLPGRDAVVYATPRDTAPIAPGSERNVWAAHLALLILRPARSAHGPAAHQSG
jgi:hypothetical protein